MADSIGNSDVLTVFKVLEGVPGDDAKSIYITSTAQVLTSPAVGGETSPATAVVTGTALNTTIDKWEYSVNGEAFSTIVPPGASRSGNIVTITGSSMAASTIAIRMSNTASGAADTLTIGKVWHGAAGSDARLALLSNESHTFAGTTNSAIAGSTTTVVSVYKGATPQTITAITFAGQPTGLTPSVTSGLNTTSPVVTFTVTTALVAQSGAVTLTITADSQTFTKVFSFAVARTGATGDQGVSVSSVKSYYRTVTAGSAAPAAPTTSTPPAPWTATEPAYAPGLELYRVELVEYSDGSYAYSPISLVSAYSGSTYVANLATALSENQVRVETSVPVDKSKGQICWLVHPAGHAQAGQLKSLLYCNGTAWVPYTLAANDILAPGTVTAGVINTESLATATAFIESLVGGEAFLRSLAVNEAVVSGANLLLEPTMRSSGAGWTGATSLRTIVSVPDGPNGVAASVMRLTPTTSDQGVSNYGFGPGGTTGIAVEPGAVFRCRMVLRKVSGTAGLVRLRAGMFRTGQSNQWPLATSSLDLATATAGEWVTVEGTVTMRDDRDLMSMSIHLTGAAGAVVEVAYVSVVRMASGSLIVDGAITAQKIVASSELSAKVAQFLDVSAERVFVGGRPILDEVSEQIGTLSESTAAGLADGLDAVDAAATDRLDSAIAGVTGQLDQLDAWRESLDNYVLIDGGGIFIGNRTDDFRVNINSSRMSFIEGDKEVAYVSNQALFIGDATITGVLTLGGFYWEAQTDGRLDFKWGG